MPAIWQQITSVSPRSFTAKRLYSYLTFAHSRQKLGQRPEDSVRLVCIADTHNSQDILPLLPDGDILVHAGDMTETGTLEEADAALAWISVQKHAHKIVVAGNHDTAFTIPQYRETLLKKYPNVTFLQDEVAIITVRGRTLQFYGNAQTSLAGSPAFAYPRISAEDAAEGDKRIWGHVPDDVDVLVTHGPPAFHLDTVNDGPQGCPALLHALWRVRPTLHVFGHIHSGRGIECVQWSGAQAAYERLCAGVGSWFDWFRLTTACVKKAVCGPGEAKSETVLANVASHLEYNDGVLRAATVVEI